MLRICSALVLLLAAGVAKADVSGRMAFSDADTLNIGGETVRVFGIDAPELDQNCKRDDGRDWACGKWAQRQVRQLFGGRQGDCRGVERDRFGRLVARCYMAGQDIAEVIVRRGIAEAYTDYSNDYVAAEKLAAQDRAGIWAGSMQSPSDYRREKAQTTAAANRATSGDCVIKGNISASGQIYHMPGQEYYAATRISTARGERWFCTEADARAAGWRPARK